MLPQEVWDTAPYANLPTGTLETRHWISEGKDFKLGKVAPPPLAVARIKTWKMLTWADTHNEERACEVQSACKEIPKHHWSGKDTSLVALEREKAR